LNARPSSANLTSDFVINEKSSSGPDLRIVKSTEKSQDSGSTEIMAWLFRKETFGFGTDLEQPYKKWGLYAVDIAAVVEQSREKHL
jgi:hypothetical protein